MFCLQRHMHCAQMNESVTQTIDGNLRDPGQMYICSKSTYRCAYHPNIQIFTFSCQKSAYGASIITWHIRYYLKRHTYSTCSDRLNSFRGQLVFKHLYSKYIRLTSCNKFLFTVCLANQQIFDLIYDYLSNYSRNYGSYFIEVIYNSSC